jgi:hypothetical protein
VQRQERDVAIPVAAHIHAADAKKNEDEAGKEKRCQPEQE